MSTDVVVIGNGMVGARFVDELLDRDTDSRHRITVLGAEEYQPYNRVLLSELVAGRVAAASLTLSGPDRPDRVSPTVHLGRAAVTIDRARRRVITAEGGSHDYDVLVLATGARARIPGIAGIAGQLPSGVHALRTLDDARAIVAATLNARRAVVIGGGVLGLEAATGLAQRGLPVTVVHAADALMERQLDVAASDAVAGRLAELGITALLSASTQEVLVADGHVRGLRLADGTTIEADLLVVSCGTIAQTDLARDAGLPVDRGIVVGDDLASPADAAVFALGDCAQPPEGGTGLIAQGWEQARRLAAALVAGSATGEDGATRSPSAVVDLTTDVVRLKASGLDVVTMGRTASAGPAGPEHRVLRLSDPGGHRLVEVVVAEGRLAGATCVGAGQVAADLAVAYTRGTPVPADPALLLMRPVAAAPDTTSSPTRMPSSMTVCRCNGVTKGDIVACLRGGGRTVADVATRTRATTGCGGCADVVRGLVDWMSSADPDQTPESAPARSQGPRGRRELELPVLKHDEHTLETSAS